MSGSILAIVVLNTTSPIVTVLIVDPLVEYSKSFVALSKLFSSFNSNLSVRIVFLNSLLLLLGQ